MRIVAPLLLCVSSFITQKPLQKNSLVKAWVSPDAPPPPHDDDEKDKPSFDPIRKYAELMGFEPEEKWKSVRYTAYYWAGFEILNEAYDKLQDYLHNPFH